MAKLYDDDPKPEKTDPDLPQPKPETPGRMLEGLQSVRVDAVVGGCLMTLNFGPNVNPAGIREAILAADPNAKVRDDFPKRGGGFGNKETKDGRAVALRLDLGGNFARIEITTNLNEDEDITVGVGKRGIPQFAQDIRALGKLKEKTLDRVQKAFDEKQEKTIILDQAEQFGVKYWTTDDGGKHFLDSMTPEPPAPKDDDDDSKDSDEKGKSSE